MERLLNADDLWPVHRGGAYGFLGDTEPAAGTEVAKFRFFENGIKYGIVAPVRSPAEAEAYAANIATTSGTVTQWVSWRHEEDGYDEGAWQTALPGAIGFSASSASKRR